MRVTHQFKRKLTCPHSRRLILHKKLTKLLVCTVTYQATMKQTSHCPHSRHLVQHRVPARVGGDMHALPSTAPPCAPTASARRHAGAAAGGAGARRGRMRRGRTRRAAERHRRNVGVDDHVIQAGGAAERDGEAQAVHLPHAKLLHRVVGQARVRRVRVQPRLPACAKAGSARALINPTQTLTSARQTRPASSGFAGARAVGAADLKWMSVAATAVRPDGSGTSMRVVLPMSLARDTYCRPPHELVMTLHRPGMSEGEACRSTDTLQAVAGVKAATVSP